VKRFGIGFLWGIVGYLVAAFAGYALIMLLSSNTHDRDLEAAMTSIFAVGPFGGMVGFVAGFLQSGRKPS
jgi:ABC-type multidrug transport system permease subunit